MKYQVGSTGRVVVARLEDGEDVLKCLVEIAKAEGIKGGVIYLLGGMRQGSVVVGPETEDFPPKPVWWRLAESHEVLAVGTVFYEGDTPKVHLHGAFGKGDSARVGCLREQSGTFLVLEAVILEINGIDAKRELDPVSGLSLLKL